MQAFDTMRAVAYVERFIDGAESLLPTLMETRGILSAAPGLVVALLELRALGFRIPPSLERRVDDLLAAALRDDCDAQGNAPPLFQRRSTRYGVMSGVSGAVYALALRAVHIGDRAGALSAVHRLHRLIRDAVLAEPTLSELYNGSAGFYVVARNLREIVPEDWGEHRSVLRDTMAVARECLLRVLRMPLSSRDSAAFSGPGTPLYLGMGHGVAGELWALYTSHEEVPSEASTRLAELRALRQEEDGFVVWPPWVGGPITGNALGSLCAGIPGMLLLWTAVAKRTGSAEDEKLAERCANTTFQVITGASHVCCGTAGQAIALEVYAAAFGDTLMRRRARARLHQAMVATPDTVNFYAGSAGIALAAAQLSQRKPRTLPCFLG